MKSLLKERYQKELRTKLQKQMGVKNVMEVPRIEKVCINVGMGSILSRGGSKDYSRIEENIRLIAGRKPVVKHARKSISNFKLREGMPVGVMVTLRGDDAYNFIDKLIHIVYPRVRGFRGVSNSVFDAFGNCSLGFNDYTVFPEAMPDDTGRPHGLQITIVTSAKDADGARTLLESFNFPFRKQ